MYPSSISLVHLISLPDDGGISSDLTVSHPFFTGGGEDDHRLAHLQLFLPGCPQAPCSSGSQTNVLIVYFKDLFIISICKYTVAVFRHTRRGRQIPLRMVVSHHVVAAN